MTVVDTHTGEPVSMAEQIIDITTERAIPFRVVYGKRQYRDGSFSKTPVVAFYDRRFGFPGHGQFVADYQRDTLLDYQRRGWPLSLNGEFPDWTIDASGMYVVLTWLNHMAYAEENF